MERNLNKKLLLIVTKYAPWFISIGYVVELILAYFGYNSFLLACLFSTGIIPIILILLFSFQFGYCVWHRLPLYYTFTTNIINAFDFYFGIPVPNKSMLIIYLILLAIFALVGAYIKNKHNVRKRNTKENIT